MCISHGQCNAQAVDGTLRTNKTWTVIDTGTSDSLALIDTTVMSYSRNVVFGKSGAMRFDLARYPQNVHIMNWDTTNIVYWKKRKDINHDTQGWNATASADTIKFHKPPKIIIIGKETYTTLFLNGHWVLMWNPASH